MRNARSSAARVDAAADLMSAGLEPGKILRAGPDVDAACRVWNQAVTRRPLLAVRCGTASDVQAALRAAQGAGLTVSVRGGGHDWAGRAVSGELVIDLGGMRGVTVVGNEAVVSGGATSMDVAEAAGRHGLAPVTGNLGPVGMAGLTLGGGYGPLTGLAGMASDNMLAAEVVLADGRTVLTDDMTEPDLLWALRGGGGNFGVVTSLRLRLHPAGHLSTGVVAFPWDQAETVAVAFGRMQRTVPDGLTVTPAFAPGPDGELTVTMLHAWSGEPCEDDRVLDMVRTLGERATVDVARSTYVDMLRAADSFLLPDLSALYRTVTLEDLQPGAVRAIVAAMAERSSPLSFVVLHPFHGAGERVPVEATAFGLRCKHFVIGIYALWQGGGGSAHEAWADAVERALAPHALPGGYPNYFGPDRPGQAARAYGPNADRLMRAKARYDPAGVFTATGLPVREADR